MTRHATISGSRQGVHRAGGVQAVRWSISPEALRMYAPAMLNGHAAQVSDAELVIEIDAASRSARATLRLRYGASDVAEHALPLPAGSSASVLCDEQSALEHVEIPGVVSLTLRRDNGSPRLVYAHSPLLGAIGLPGGVYDVPELL